MKTKRILAFLCAIFCTASAFSSCVFLPSTSNSSESDSAVESSSEISSLVDSSSEEEDSSQDSSSSGPIKYDVTFVYDDKLEKDNTIDSQMTIRTSSPLSGAPYSSDKSIIGWTASPKVDYNTVDFPMELTENVTLYAVRQSDFEHYLPVIHVDTNGVKPSKTEEYTPASITLENTEERFAFENLSAGIRRRGNSTATFAKKPYRIKFDQKISMFGETAHKSWVLLAMYIDPSLIRDYLGHTLAQRFDNLEFASCAYHVELYLNGAYQGVYLLCDQIEEQPDSRIAVEIDEYELRNMTEVPFIIEKNQTRSAGESQYPYDWFEGEGKTQYTIKYPENPTKEQYEYIKNYFLTVEEALREDDYNTVVDMVDVESAYDWFLINEFMYNFDAVQLSGYFYKTVDGKMKLGPVWDFDNSFLPTYTGLVSTVRNLSLANKDLFTRKAFRPTFMQYMFQNEIFKAEFCTRWKEMRYEVIEVINHLKKYRIALRPAALRNNELWYKDLTLDDGSGYKYVADNQNIFEDQYDFIEEFLPKRMAFFRISYIPYSL